MASAAGRPARRHPAVWAVLAADAGAGRWLAHRACRRLACRRGPSAAAATATPHDPRLHRGRCPATTRRERLDLASSTRWPTPPAPASSPSTTGRPTTRPPCSPSWPTPTASGTGCCARTNRGKGEAVRRGMLAAVAGGAELVALLRRRLRHAPRRGGTPRRRAADRRPRRRRARQPGGDAGRRHPPLGPAALHRPAVRHRRQPRARRPGLRHPVRRQGVPRHGRLRAALAEPFVSRWAFDVELLGRLLPRGRGDAPSGSSSCPFANGVSRWFQADPAAGSALSSIWCGSGGRCATGASRSAQGGRRGRGIPANV